MINQQEKWLPVNGFEEQYMVSNFGRVKRKFKFNEKFLPGNRNKDGYLTILLVNKTNRSCQYIHRMVAINFIPNPENKKTVNHIDGNKENNHIDNLEWATHSENHLHAFKKLNRKSSTNRYWGRTGKLKPNEVLFIRNSNLKGVELAKMFNVSKGTISNILAMKRWKQIK
jgi:DNA-binding transcriptional regulator YiaG